MLGTISRHPSFKRFLVAGAGAAAGVFAGSLLYIATAWSASDLDPRLEIPKVRRCVDQVKEFLTSTEYSTNEQNVNIIAACRNADPECVAVVGESLDSHERAKADNFLPLVRSCSGEGMGKCYKSVIDAVPSFDRNETKEAQVLLKKCE